MAAIPVEYASERKIRERNKLYYRFNHWPIWIFVFFIAPGPLTFDLFERGFDSRMALWLGAVLLGTAIAGLRGRLPGVEPKPYIIRFTEDRPNPLYRRVCYTFAWSEVITFAVLNVTGLVVAIVTGGWHLKMSQIYRVAYFPLAGSIWLLGALGQVAAREGVDERRGARAALFLRVGVGRVLGAARAVADVESAAAHARRRLRSSWPCFSPFSRSWAPWREGAGCRARARSSQASWRCRTEAPLTKAEDRPPSHYRQCRAAWSHEGHRRRCA